jgi:hypothetical protein
MKYFSSDILSKMLYISMGKRKAPTAGRLFLIIFSVSFLSLTEKKGTLFAYVLIKKKHFLFTGLLRQAVSKGLCCVGTSISDTKTDLVPEVVFFKKKTNTVHCGETCPK